MRAANLILNNLTMKNNTFEFHKSYIKFYLLFFIVISIAILTPHIVHGHLWIPEEFAQSVVLGIDMIIAYFFYSLYLRDVAKIKEDKERIESNLLDAYKHVGSVNRKNEILGKFLEFMNDQNDNFSDKDIFQYLMREILVSVAKANKGLLRFVDAETSRTIKEYQYHKDGDQFVIKVSNKQLLSGQFKDTDNIRFLESSISQSGIKCFLFYEPSQKEMPDKNFIKSLVNQAYLLFLANQKKQLSYKNF